mmetsp:Transcript_2981/g.7017  ORF Transcript_2981/g.7017 Transcript_2981/m.7017 type:complete len:103 (+) Transcript_2981:763-1071(+)
MQTTHHTVGSMSISRGGRGLPRHVLAANFGPLQLFYPIRPTDRPAESFRAEEKVSGKVLSIIKLTKIVPLENQDKCGGSILLVESSIVRPADQWWYLVLQRD